MFKSGDGGLTSHSGKVIQEFIQSLPAFQIVKQSLERDACAGENRRSSENLRILHDDLSALRHNSLPFQLPTTAWHNICAQHQKWP